MDFILIGLVVLAMWAGWFLRGITLLARMGRDPDHFINLLKEIKKINEQQDQKENTEKQDTLLEIEKHGDMLYAFVKETDQFIAQGPSMESIMQEAAKRFPNRKFSVKQI